MHQTEKESSTEYKIEGLKSYMSWRDKILESLDKRDQIERPATGVFSSCECEVMRRLTHLTNRFEVDTLYQRLTEAEKQLSRLKSNDSQSEVQELFEENEQLKAQLKIAKEESKQSVAQSKANEAEVLKLKKENVTLNKAVTRLTDKLNHQTEEYYHKNKSIEIINDEIISLSIQNNLLTDKLVKLENENGDLVQRWIEKVKSDADKMNETNAFLESHKTR